jgi:hypothetical protein
VGTAHEWSRIAVQALLILCLTATLAAQTEWKKYEEPDGNFSVLFPGEPKDTVSPSREGIESSHGFSASDGSIYVGVFYARMKQEQKVDEANYETYKKSFFTSLPKCDELNSTVASPTFSGYIGHGYRLECEGQNAKGQTVSGTLVLNLYFGKHFLYVVTAGSTIRPDPPTIKKFMDSFSVTDVGR